MSSMASVREMMWKGTWILCGQVCVGCWKDRHWELEARHVAGNGYHQLAWYRLRRALFVRCFPFFWGKRVRTFFFVFVVLERVLLASKMRVQHE